MRSFTLNSEVSLVLFGQDLTAELRAEQDRYFSGSDILLAKQWKSRPLAPKIVENIARLLTPLL
jgi:cardiolipin synthase